MHKINQKHIATILFRATRKREVIWPREQRQFLTGKFKTNRIVIEDVETRIKSNGRYCQQEKYSMLENIEYIQRMYGVCKKMGNFGIAGKRKIKPTRISILAQKRTATHTAIKYPNPATIFEALETGRKLGATVEDGMLSDAEETGKMYADVVPTDGA